MRQAPWMAFVLVMAVAGLARAQDGLFPSDAGVLNLRDFGAKGDGVADDTEAFRKAIDQLRAHRTLYIPNGHYLVSESIQFLRRDNGEQLVWITVRGQSRDGTVIKLRDRSPSFDNPEQRNWLFQLKKGNEAFEHRFMDFTLDVGVGNPGACGIRWSACNGGILRNVRIVSSDPDGAGAMGVDSMVVSPGRSLIRYVTVEGFDYGFTLDTIVNGFGYEHITLKGQRKAGMYFKSNNAVVRDLRSDNRSPAVVLEKEASIALIDADLRGGAADQVAIDSDGVVFARNVRAEGYGVVLRSGADRLSGTSIDEYASTPVDSPFPSDHRSLNLPAEEAPEVPWDAGDNFANWVNVTKFGADPAEKNDDTDALAAAIDHAQRAGKSTLYFPPGEYRVSRTLEIGGTIRRLIGMPARIGSLQTNRQYPFYPHFANDAEPVIFRFTGGTDAVVLESLSLSGIVEHAAANTMVFRYGGHTHYRNTVTGGKAFFEDYGAGTSMQIKGPQQVWKRFWDGHGVHPLAPYLPRDGQRQIGADNDGGTLWLFAVHGEGKNPFCTVRNTNGAKTEVLSINSGAHWGSDDQWPAAHFTEFINQDSELSVAAWHVAYHTVIEDRRNGWSRYVLGPDKRALAVCKPVPDSTPPPAVSHLNAEPRGQWPFQVVLNWQAATDEQSGIAGYEVSRDGEHLAWTVQPSHTDELMRDDAQVTYTVKAINGAIQQSPPATVTARTLKDTTELSLAAVAAAASDGKIHLVFSKPLDAQSVEKVTQYRVDPEIAIESAMLENDLRTVTLKTSGLKAGEAYTVTARAVRDRSSPPKALDLSARDFQAMPPGRGLVASYFATPDMEGDPAAKIVGGSIDADWIDFSPLPDLPVDGFAMRWRGRLRAEFSEPYTFVIRSGDAVRVRLAGQTIFDTWQASEKFADSGANLRPSATVPLIAGRLYDIEVDYMDRGGRAWVSLLWQSPSTPQQAVPVECLYRPADVDKPWIEYALAVDDRVHILFSDSVDAETARQAKRYRIGGGVKVDRADVSADGRNVVLTTRGLNPGQAYSLEIEGGMRATFESAKADAHGLFGDYYNNLWNHPGARVVAQRLDPTVDFDWGKGSPMEEVGNDSIRVVWRGWIVPEVSDNYTFSVDIAEWDAVEMQIDGQTAIKCDKRHNRERGTFSSTMALRAGLPAPIHFLFRDKDWTADGGAARVQLLWESPGIARQVMPSSNLYAPDAFDKH